jgi:hypothetical protein
MHSYRLYIIPCDHQTSTCCNYIKKTLLKAVTRGLSLIDVVVSSKDSLSVLLVVSLVWNFFVSASIMHVINFIFWYNNNKNNMPFAYYLLEWHWNWYSVHVVHGIKIIRILFTKKYIYLYLPLPLNLIIKKLWRTMYKKKLSERY